MSLEDQIFLACDENPRDWTPEEKDLIRESRGVRRALLRWYHLSQDLYVDCWTAENKAFLEELKGNGL